MTDDDSDTENDIWTLIGQSDSIRLGRLALHIKSKLDRAHENIADLEDRPKDAQRAINAYEMCERGGHQWMKKHRS